MVDVFLEKSRMLTVVCLDDIDSVPCLVKRERHGDQLLSNIIDFVRNEAVKSMDAMYTKSMQKWFQERYEPFLRKEEVNSFGEDIRSRPILVYFDESCGNDPKIAGIGLMKRTVDEQRVAMIYVSNEYRNKGVAQNIFLRTHSILTLESCLPYVYINQDILEKFPFLPHIMIKSGYSFSHDLNPDNSKPEFYFSMNRNFSRLMHTFERSMTSNDAHFISGTFGSSIPLEKK